MKLSWRTDHWCGWRTGALMVAGLLATAASADTGPREVTVVAGREARLPCPQLDFEQRSSISLVIWFRDDMENPIYSFDNRRGRKAQHWADAALLGHSRASFRPTEGHLVLQGAGPADQGRYRCRVDFSRVPTVTGDVLLQVIVPPQPPVIQDDQGNVIANQSLLSRSEGERIRLTCQVRHGYPPPRVTWLVQNGSGVVRHSQPQLMQDDSVRSELELPPLRRADLRANVTCQAANNNVTGPVSTTVTLDVFFRPLRVQLDGESGALSVGRQYEYVCSSSGSRPPAVLTWYLDGAALVNARQHVSPDGGSSSSTLQLRPKLDDQGKTLSCRAHNPRMTGTSPIQDDRRLNIRFPPTTTLRLSPMIGADNVREGMGVYFDCLVHANPPASRVVWLHEGAEVSMDRRAGVLVSSSSLVLQNVSRLAAGPYQCRAANSEGESTSNTVLLRVMYAPVCAEGQRRVYGVSVGDQAAVLCRVDADPAPVEFSWLLNGSDQVRPLSAGVTDWPAGPLTSSLAVQPRNDADYGTLLCSSRNRVGHQAQPCAFSLVPAGPPEPVHQCQVANQTDVSFEVHCASGFDGGLQQHFTLELYSQQRRLQLNTSRAGPHFTVTGLRPGLQYTALVYAANQKGSSRRVRIAVATQLAAEQRTGQSTQGSMAEPRPSVGWAPLA
ncbi:hemicentin-1-like, partial [Pollicipes pollicipes]|uniref:hemicentin-1-like n=1 Tax=Pollicipes pollicipes TaxID=41117 RepID=UPI0018858064